MEQKDYKLEIVLLLLKQRSYAREIARKLETNHMMIIRKLKELFEKNVIDCHFEGKNKIYFLKKTAEAKNHVFIAETYNLLRLIEKYPSLRIVLEKIQENKKVKMALLFGSYAKGLAKEGSDIDIYIDTEDRELKKGLSKIDSKLNIKIGGFTLSSLLIREIIKNHIIIKGAEIYYEKNKIFS